MIELNSPRWLEFSHAYGDASDIPALLRQLPTTEQKSLDDYRAEPWFSLWSALCHQGNIYPATYAAVPHIVDIAFGLQETPHWQYFAFPATVEIQRQKHDAPPIPDDLAAAYFSALQGLHNLANKIATHDWDELLAQSITAALLVSKGHWLLADTMFEITSENLNDVRQYLELDEPDE